MSHSNGSIPHFHYNVQEVPNQYNFDSQLPQLSNNSAQPWFSSNSRSVQHNVRSPSTSVMSTATAPVQHRSRFCHNDVSQLDDPIDPNLPNMSGLLTPTSHALRNNYSPIARSFQDDSWNPLHLRNAGLVDACAPSHHANASFGAYRNGPGSVGSAAPVSDSGYQTQSVISNDQTRNDKPGLPLGVTFHGGNLPGQLTANDAPGTVQVLSDQRSQLSSQSGHSRIRSKQFKCPQCGDISKCKSDFKCVLRLSICAEAC
jgi:hypothetical protein